MPATRQAPSPTSCRRSTRWRSWPRPAASTAPSTRRPRTSWPRCSTLVDQVDDNVFLAKLAVYSRERAFMKDMPAALLLVLSKRDRGLVPQGLRPRRRQRPRAAHAVPDDPLGPVRPQEPVVRAAAGVPALAERGAASSKLLSASIGNDPSLRDVLRLARPTPKDNARRALFGWLTDKPVEKWAPATADDLPERGPVARCLPPGGDGRRAGRDPDGDRRPLGPAGGCRPRSARLEGDCPPDGSAGAAHEPEHAAASRAF